MCCETPFNELSYTFIMSVLALFCCPKLYSMLSFFQLSKLVFLLSISAHPHSSIVSACTSCPPFTSCCLLLPQQTKMFSTSDVNAGFMSGEENLPRHQQDATHPPASLKKKGVVAVVGGVAALALMGVMAFTSNNGATTAATAHQTNTESLLSASLASSMTPASALDTLNDMEHSVVKTFFSAHHSSTLGEQGMDQQEAESEVDETATADADADEEDEVADEEGEETDEEGLDYSNFEHRRLQSSCICLWGTGCVNDSSCCGGLTCQQYSGWSQCLEPSFVLSKTGCVKTDNVS